MRERWECAYITGRRMRRDGGAVFVLREGVLSPCGRESPFQFILGRLRGGGSGSFPSRGRVISLRAAQYHHLLSPCRQYDCRAALPTVKESFEGVITLTDAGEGPF